MKRETNRIYPSFFLIFSLFFVDCASQTKPPIPPFPASIAPSPFHDKGVGSFLLGMQLSQVTSNPDCHNYEQSEQNRFVWNCEGFTQLDGKTPYHLRFIFSESDLVEIDVILGQSSQPEIGKPELQLLLSQMKLQMVDNLLHLERYKEKWHPDEKDRQFQITYNWPKPLNLQSSSFTQELQEFSRIEISVSELNLSGPFQKVGGFLERSFSPYHTEFGLFYRLEKNGFSSINVLPKLPSHEIVKTTQLTGFQAFELGMNQKQASSLCSMKQAIINPNKDIYLETYKRGIPGEKPQYGSPEILCDHYFWNGFTSLATLTFTKRCLWPMGEQKVWPEPRLTSIAVKVLFPSNPVSVKGMINRLFPFLYKTYGTLDEISVPIPKNFYYFPEITETKVQQLFQKPPHVSLLFSTGASLELHPDFFLLQLDPDVNLCQELKTKYPMFLNPKK